MLGKDCFVTVVKDYDSSKIFVRVRNFKQMKRLGSVTVFVGGDYHLYSVSKLALWQLGVSPGIVQGVLVAWGRHVHQ